MTSAHSADHVTVADLYHLGVQWLENIRMRGAPGSKGCGQMLTEFVYLGFSCTRFTGGDQHSREESSTCISYGWHLLKVTDNKAERECTSNWHLRVFVETNSTPTANTHTLQTTGVRPRPKLVLPCTCLLASVHAVPSVGTLPFLLGFVLPGDPAAGHQAEQHSRSSASEGPPLCGARPPKLVTLSKAPVGWSLSCDCLPFVSCTQAKRAPCSGRLSAVPGMGSNQRNLLNEGSLEGRNAWRGTGGSGGGCH